MKKILGLDIGTNSIGWAFIESNVYDNPEVLEGKIIQLGSRIIPMDADSLSKFETGQPVSKAAGRRQARSARRLIQRYKLRRSRLITALKILGWLPDEFPEDFNKINKHSINKYLPFSDDIKKEAAVYFGITDKKNSKGNEFSISEDWLIYFLKTKALHTKIRLPELARILYHYNQRRGFKSSRKEAKIEEESNEVRFPHYEKWIEIVKVTEISDLGKGEGKDKEFTFYEVSCETPELHFKTIKKRLNPLDWLNKNIEVEITKKTTKDGNFTYNISEIDPKAWENRKRALEKDIERESLSISEYYLNNIKRGLHNGESYVVKQRIVDRSLYQNEFKQIWAEQNKHYNHIFTDHLKIETIADTFYCFNKQKNAELKGKDLFNIFFNDIIYYQRSLKSQKSLIANCQFEYKTFKTKDGSKKKSGVKVISKSSPIFQEFRIWQNINNLNIIQKEAIINGKLKLNVDVSALFINDEIKERLFELFDSSIEVTHEAILKLFGFKKDIIENGEKSFSYKLNFPENLNFPGNETKSLFRKIFRKHNSVEVGEKYLSNEKSFLHLWHIIYSLPEEKDIIKALNNKQYFDLPEDVIKHFSKLPEFKSQFASLSFKAINKMLPLMRCGKYWSENSIDESSKERLNKLITGEYDDSISNNLRDQFSKLNIQFLNDLKGLPTYAAAYILYGRHSERENEDKYASFDDFKINEIIPHNSLRNPVVEKTIRETPKLVKDIWKNEKMGRPDYIHVELGRELKNNRADREKLADLNYKNKIEKDRIVKLLKELNLNNFNENSLGDIEKFKLWKESGGKQGEEEFEILFKKNNSDFVKEADIEKYKHWAEQNYRSPYTGRIIKLSELFTENYEIDHIIPRAKFYDDSFSNKVVVEAEVNKFKNNRLAIQFIEDVQGTDIKLSNGELIKVLSMEDYLRFIDEVFSNKKKKNHLKSYEVPEGFIERQLNDTKYISRTVAQFLRPVSAGTESDEGVIYTSGAITSDLKNKWGLNKLWKDILRPRFERLESILEEKLIFPSVTKAGDYHFGKEYKRIDHRHHALDALIIACTSRRHIKYINSLNSFSNDKKDIIRYNDWSKWKYLLNKKKQLDNNKNGMTEFEMPWKSFYQEAKDAIESIIVSHKPTSRLVSKSYNKYYKWAKDEDGNFVKKLHHQIPPLDEDKYWVAVRQSLFGQPLGKIYLAEYKNGVDIKAAVKAQIQFKKREINTWNSEDWRIAKSELRKRIDRLIQQFSNDEKSILKYLSENPLTDNNGNVIEKTDLLQFKKYASKRVAIDESFTTDKIEKLPYSNIEKKWLTKLLKEHLAEYGNDPKKAFKGEMLELLFKKAGFRINKVTRKESGEKIELKNKFLDGDAGVNQFFVVEIRKEINNKTGEEITTRKYYTPPFLECIERLAKGLPIHDENSGSKYVVLSPGELVYVPREDECISKIDWENKKDLSDRVYLMKSSNSSTCYFLPSTVSSLIEKGEFESLGKSEKTKDGKQVIKENFIKLKVDRLGNFIPQL